MDRLFSNYKDDNLFNKLYIKNICLYKCENFLIIDELNFFLNFGTLFYLITNNILYNLNVKHS